MVFGLCIYLQSTVGRRDMSILAWKKEKKGLSRLTKLLIVSIVEGDPGIKERT